MSGLPLPDGENSINLAAQVFLKKGQASGIVLQTWIKRKPRRMSLYCGDERWTMREDFFGKMGGSSVSWLIEATPRRGTLNECLEDYLTLEENGKRFKLDTTRLLTALERGERRM